MAVRANVTLINYSGGEVSPELYSRSDLPIYQRGAEWIQNYIVLPQGGQLYRNGKSHVKSTRQNLDGRLISFKFSQQDTYVLEFTDRKIRFYRDGGAVLNDAAAKDITLINRLSPAGIVTSAAHGFVDGQEIYISGVEGMVEFNNQFFTIYQHDSNAFTLKNALGVVVDTSSFNLYESGGKATPVFEIDSPYRAEHIKELHVKQSADTIYITHLRYPPCKLSRKGHLDWTIETFERDNDPFKQKAITGISKANPGVVSISAHGFEVDDEVYIDGIKGMTELASGWYKINSVTTNSFTLKTLDGVAVNTTSFSTWTEGGIVINTNFCPKTVAFLDQVRLAYGNWNEDPAGMAFSRAPDTKTGETRFDNFDVSLNDATESIRISLQPVFDTMDAIQWIATINRSVIVGCSTSVRKITGDTEDQPLSPTSINSRPLSNVGALGVQPYCSGQSLFYIDVTGIRLNTVLFSFQSSDYVTANQNLAANQLGSSPFVAVAQQRGDSGLLWVLREDGVLTGLTFNELESIYGWHRHYIGGKSTHEGVEYDRAKVLSICTEPRLNKESVLWAIVERTVNGQTYRSVEYLNQPVRFVEEDDFYSGDGYDNQKADLLRYNNATYEQLKDSIHVDSAISYDGSSFAAGVTLTPTATTGDITVTASASVFTAEMVGREIWKKYDKRGRGGGRIRIEGVLSSTQVLGTVIAPLDSDAVIASGGWYLTTDKVYGLLHLVGETVDVQVDGAPGGKYVVQPGGSIQLGSQSSKVHVGFGYLGLSMSLNLDLAGPRGSTSSQIRKIRRFYPRFRNTVGAKIGTTLWNCKPVVFKDVDDLTDRPTRLNNSLLEIIPPDSHTRQRKQCVLMQDKPSPQQLLSMDIELEAATD